MIALVLSLLTFCIVKIAIILGAGHEEKNLKNIVVTVIYTFLQLKKNQALPLNCLLKTDSDKIMKGTLKSISSSWKRHLICWKGSLTASIVILALSTGLSLLFYDLYVLSCMFEPPEHFKIILGRLDKFSFDIILTSKSKSKSGRSLLNYFSNILFILNYFFFTFIPFKLLIL